MANTNTHILQSPSPRREHLNDFAPLYPCRIAIYDDPVAPPQIIEIAPQPVDSYMNAITQEVIDVLRGFRSSIPFMVIRECVENLIHASFKSPTISILQKGNLVRFSDQGPGISHKETALEFGTSTATEAMRKYIRGVGSGLPIAHQYMQDKGGSLIIEDNLDQGCLITISLTDDRNPFNKKGTPVRSFKTIEQKKGRKRISPALKDPFNQVSLAINYGEEMKKSSSTHVLEEKEHFALLLCLTREKIGPTDLVQLFGHSLSTWSRTLQHLVALGLMHKPIHQQKYYLTSTGKDYTIHNI